MLRLIIEAIEAKLKEQESTIYWSKREIDELKAKLAAAEKELAAYKKKEERK